MKTRKEVVTFIAAQLQGDSRMAHYTAHTKEGKHHYGLSELRALIDFIYNGQPSLGGDELIYPDGRG